MRFRILSDPHADFTGGKLVLPPVDCDANLIVGDGAAPMTLALRIIAEAFKDSTAPIYYTPGNHDFYVSEAEPRTFYQDQVERGRELARELGITLLINEVAYLGDVRILGTPLWTNFGQRPDSMSLKMAMMQSQRGWIQEGYGGRADRDYHNDFREIRFGGSGSKNRFTPSQWLSLHAEAMTFLRTELAKDDWTGATVVASHMPASPLMLKPGGPRTHDWLYCATDCGDLFQYVDLWASGHVHHSADVEIDGCRLLSNPRGYPRPGGGFENPAWDPTLVVDVERKYAPKFGRM
jgi:hypothetical protein